jgi:2-oxoglutarate ferredoxin oxidoreductase subunit delta
LSKQLTYPVVNQKRCKKCGICSKICPRKVFEPGTDGLPCVTCPEKCNACELCVNHCPDFAIEVKKMPDPASY